MSQEKVLNELKQMANGVLIALLIGFALGMFSHVSAGWISDLFSHFQIQYAVGALILAIIQAFFKDAKLCGLSAIVFFMSMIQIYGGFTEAPIVYSRTDYKDIKIVHYNRHFDLRAHGALLEFITSEDPDIVVIAEASQHHSDALKTLINEYPYQIHEPRNNAFGAAIISKHPFREEKVTHFESIALDNIQIRFTLDFGDDIASAFYVIHPPPPISQAYYMQRNMELTQTAYDVRTDAYNNVIMMGDWNITPFSSHFKSVLGLTGLKNSYTDGLIFPTWPAPLGLPIFQIPIDHILHKGSMDLIEKTRGPSMGSDHYPIIATYRLYPQK